MVPGGLDHIWTFIASVHCDIMLIRKDEKEVAVRWSLERTQTLQRMRHVTSQGTPTAMSP